MSADSIQKKINNAHKKVGKVLGYTYGLYRPLGSNVDIIQDRNLIKEMKATFTLNDNYSSNVKWEVPTWTVYTETAELQIGDYLYNEQYDRTFFVFSLQPHQPVYVIEANERINIQSVAYANDGTGFAPAQTTYIAKNLPCFITYGSGSVSGDLPGGGVGSIPFRTMVVHTALPETSMLLGETLVDTDGFKGDVTSYDISSVGSGVRITAAERGFPSAS